MLTENKFGKYLIYAIGEILLVVIGILIALQINTWNQGRNDRKIETQALISLKAEFNENQDRLESLMRIKKRQENDGRSFLDIITNDTIPLSDKLNAKPPEGFGGTWSVTNAVLNSLLSTGMIEKIKNDTLKFLLTNWSVKVDKFEVAEQKFLSATDAKGNYMRGKTYSGIVKSGDYSGGRWPGNYRPNNIASKSDSLKATYITDMKYYNYHSLIITRLYIQLIDATELQMDYKKIEQLIDLELKDRNI